MAKAKIKTAIASLKGFASKKLLTNVWIRITTKKSPKVYRINPVSRNMAMSASIANSSIAIIK